MKTICIIIILNFLSCAKIQDSSMGGISGLLLAIGGIESTYKNAPLIEMNFQFQKGSGDYLSQKIVTYEFIADSSSNSTRVAYSTDNGEGSTDVEGRFKLVVSTVGKMKFYLLEPADRTPLGSFTTTIAPELKKEDVKMENVEGNLGIQVLSISNSYNTYTTQEVVSNIVAPSNLVYSTSSIIGVRNTPLISYQPNYKGTTPLTFSISPALPTGMNISSSTGVISGTPLAITAVASYIVTVSNSKGATTFPLSIRVNDSPPSSLVYSTTNFVLVRNTLLTTLIPTVSGSVTGYAFSISPALPTGLNFNTSTGAISGTPTVLSPLTSYLVTVTNSAGSLTTSLNFTVNDSPPTVLSYSGPPFSIIRDRAFNVTPSAVGANLVFSINPSLPTGLSLNTTNGNISGTPTVVSSNASYTVTASNTGGNITSTFNLEVSVLSCIAGQYFNAGYCVNVGKGYYSTGDNVRRVCTTSVTPGSNLDYVRDNSNVPDCEVACADNYYLNNGSCVYSPGAKAMTCNQGYYATGIYGAAGGIFDSFGLRCGVISNGSTSGVYNGAKNSYGTGGSPFTADCGSGQAIARIYSAVGVSFDGQYPLMSQFSFYCKNTSSGLDGSSYGAYGSTTGSMVNLVCDPGKYAYGVVSRLATGCTDFTNCNGSAFTGFAREIIGILCK
jgi:hypothetical protein